MKVGKPKEGWCINTVIENWSINICEDTQYHHSSGKSKLKSSWDTNMHLPDG